MILANAWSVLHRNKDEFQRFQFLSFIAEKYGEPTTSQIQRLAELSENCEDYFNTIHCCVTCKKPEKKQGCLCFDCRCRHCDWYEIKVAGFDKDWNKPHKKCKYGDYYHEKE